MTENQIDCTFIGVDIAQEKFDVYEKMLGHWQEANTEKGIAHFIKKIKKLSQCFQVILEASGGYERPLIDALHKAGIPASVVNPKRVRDFAKCIGILAKTDRLDAQIIVQWADMAKPEPQKAPSALQQEITALHTCRSQIVEMLVMQKNRLATASALVHSYIKATIKSLETQLEKVEKALENCVKKDEETPKKIQWLRSVKGVGLITPYGLLATLPELGTLEHAQIVALAGLAPYNCDSGKFAGKRRILGGRASVRVVLYMATLVATRHQPQIKAFYQHLREKGKLPKVALTACMRKLLIMLNALCQRKDSWKELPPSKSQSTLETVVM